MERKRSRVRQNWKYPLYSIALGDSKKSEPKDGVFCHRVKWKKQIVKQNEPR